MNEELKELLGKSPFVPFAFVMTSGDRYRVDNPEMVVVGEAAITVVRPRSERRDILRLNQIAAFEVLDPAD